MPEPADSEQPLEWEGTEHTPAARPSLPRLPPLATVDTVADGARIGVIVRGELDLDADQRLRPDLIDALSCSAEGVDLYLSEVTFCDCSGIHLLLDLRRLALRHGKTVTVLSSSAVVERMFDLTATHGLLEPYEPPALIPEPAPEGENGIGPPADGEANPGTDTDDSLRTVVAQLRRAMQTRPTIDLARGILMSVFSLSPEASWDVLVTASQNTNTKLHRLAEDLVGTVHGPDLPEAVQSQLAAAVAKANKARAAPGAGSGSAEGSGNDPQPDSPHTGPGPLGTSQVAATPPVPPPGLT